MTPRKGNVIQEEEHNVDNESNHHREDRQSDSGVIGNIPFTEDFQLVEDSLVIVRHSLKSDVVVSSYLF